MAERRKDRKGRVLKEGESQRKDGSYDFRWRTSDGKRHSALVPRFLVLVNPSMNEMHLLPIFIKKDSSRFYNCPPALLIPNGHSTFTKDFDSVHMVLETSVIYYYGINTETCEPEITELTYSQSEKCYQITDGQFIRPIEEFEKELAKEALYLKQNAQ